MKINEQTKSELLFIGIILLEYILIHRFMFHQMYIGQLFVLFLLLIVISNYNARFIFINCLFIFTLIIVFLYMKENNKLKNIESFQSGNSKLKKFINNKKIKRSESPLNTIKEGRKGKEEFGDTEKIKRKKENMQNILLSKKYNSSIKSISKKLPVFIDKFKKIFNS